MTNPKLIDKLSAALPSPGRKLLYALLALAAAERQPVYLVGGSVRDLLVGRPPLDLDTVVEADAMPLARRLAEQTGARVRTHPAFLTAAVRLDNFVLDIATARKETYAHPGALPAVTPASIRDDLLRRDFTINAMAMPLSVKGRMTILDPSAGQADLKIGLVRSLQPESFQDDATRILRAARYEARFDFRIEGATLEWLRRDVGYLDTISGTRIRQELSRILAEPEPERALRRLDHLGALRAIHPALSFGRLQARAAATLRALPRRPPSVALWPLLFWGVAEAQIPDLCRRLALTKPERTAVEALPSLRALVAQRLQARRNLKRSALVDSLAPYPPAAVWALAAASESRLVRERCLDYLTNARYVKPSLRGGDVIALGVPQGPAIGDVLCRLRDAKLDGDVKSRRDEKRLVRRLLDAGSSSSSLHLSSSSR